MVKTMIASLLAGVLYTIFMGLYFKKEGVTPSRKYVSGVIFTVVLFFVLWVLKVF